MPQKESAKGGGKLLSALCAEGVFRLVLGIGQHGEKKIVYQKAKGENTALQGREFIFCGFFHHRGEEKGNAAKKGQEQ